MILLKIKYALKDFVCQSTLMLFLVLGVLFSACEEPLDYASYNTLDPVLLVEGKITTDTTKHYVILSQTTALTTSEQVWVSNADVVIESSTETILLTEDSNAPGHYYTAPDVFGVMGQSYTLQINLSNGESYSATTEISNIPEIDSINFLYEEFADYDLYFHNLYYHGWELEEEGNAYLWNLYINESLFNDTLWKTTFVDDEFVNGNYIGVNESTGESNFAIYVLQPYEVIADTLNVLVEMESIPHAYYDFYQVLLAQTVNVGSPFDAVKADLLTNISNGALGYFYGAAIRRYSFIYIPPEASKTVDQEPF
jgi:uncharacterized protein (DUF427 family)